MKVKSDIKNQPTDIIPLVVGCVTALSARPPALTLKVFQCK